MTYVPYKSSDVNWYWRGPESAYRDYNGNSTLDETNLNTATFWHLPVAIHAENQPSNVRLYKSWSKHYGMGSRYQKQISRTGYKEQRITFSGPLRDFSWMYYLTDETVTQDNTPSAGYYTHTHDTDNTLVNPPKSFELMRTLPNDKSGGGETKVSLFVGCTVISASLRGGQDGTIMADFEVIMGKEITGTALNTPPTIPAKDFLNFFDGVLTWTKGGTALNYQLLSFRFIFKTTKMVQKGDLDYFPTTTLSPNKIDVYLGITARPTELDVYDDTQDDPHTAHNKDISLKISRNTTTDYLQFNFLNCFQELIEQGFNNGYEEIEIHSWINPHEAGSKMTIVEVNNLDDDRYET